MIKRSFDGNFGEFGPFYGIYGALSWNGWLQSPQSSYFYKLVQLKILNVDKMALKWC